jgi:hypothetical protein
MRLSVIFSNHPLHICKGGQFQLTLKANAYVCLIITNGRSLSEKERALPL